MGNRILLVDDHKVVLRGLELLFNEYEEFDIIGMAQNIDSALSIMKEEKPDVIITDLSIGAESGIDLIKQIRKTDQNVKIVVLSMHLDKSRVLDTINNGANAFVSKDADESELIQAVRNVTQNKSYLSTTISDILTKSLFVSPSQKEEAELFENLTKREKEILVHITEGKSNKMIATELNISERTVSAHRYNLMKKLNAPNAASLVKKAIDYNLV